MAQSQLKSLNCTNCGAPLSLNGGHKVQSLTCGYCGSVLDSNDEFKVVRTYTDLKRPYCPIKIGMRGTLLGVEFTAIGVVQYSDEDYSSWLEVALFSPTHGYVWLEYDHGHFVFSRRTRELPEHEGGLHHKSTFMAAGYAFNTHSIYTATVTFVEGELTYLAQVGNRVRLIEGIAPPFGYTIEATGEEQEYQLSEYMQPSEVYEAFKLDATEARERHHVHPLQPYEPSGFVSGLQLAGLIFAPIALLLVLYTVAMGNGTSLLKQSFTAQQIYSKSGVKTQAFQVTDTDNLLSLDLDSNLNNAWGFYDVVIKFGKQEIFSMGKQISYYSGSSGGEPWSEGSTNAEAYFKLPQTGNYTLEIRGEGGTGSRGTRPQARGMLVEVREGVKISRYYLILFVLCIGAAWVVGWLAKRKFEAARWDDDDD